MPNLVQWSDVGTKTLLIAGDASTPTLKNLASNALKLSNEVDPGVTPDSFADFVLRVRGASAFIANEAVLGWFVLDVGDAGAYEDGGDSVEPLRTPDLIFIPRLVSTQQVIAARQVELPKCPWKMLLKNSSARGLTNTDDENQLHYSTYNKEIQ